MNTYKIIKDFKRDVPFITFQFFSFVASFNKHQLMYGIVFIILFALQSWVLNPIIGGYSVPVSLILPTIVFIVGNLKAPQRKAETPPDMYFDQYLLMRYRKSREIRHYIYKKEVD